MHSIGKMYSMLTDKCPESHHHTGNKYGHQWFKSQCIQDRSSSFAFKASSLKFQSRERPAQMIRRLWSWCLGQPDSNSRLVDDSYDHRSSSYDDHDK